MAKKLRMTVYTIGNMKYTVDVTSDIEVRDESIRFVDINGEYIKKPMSFLLKITLE